MKALLAALVAIVSPAAASAQINIASSLANSPSDYTSYRSSVDSRAPFGSHETPSMRRQKLARAVALRSEAAQLVERDGGTLTEAHQRYVQRKARDILAYDR